MPVDGGLRSADDGPVPLGTSDCGSAREKANDMEILPLGCLAGMPSAGQASSGYLVSDGSTTVMLDAGPGTAVALSRRLGDRPLSAVFVSHRHSDHILDLLPIGKMMLARRMRARDAAAGSEIDESVPPVPLFVPAGTMPVLREYAALFPVSTHPLLDRAFESGFDVHEYEPGETAHVAGLTMRFELLRHASPNCGVRIESGDSSLVFTGDTGVTDALPALADGAGTLLSESTLRDADRSDHGHLSSADAGRAASDAGVRELILTHFATTDPIELGWHRDRAAEQFAGSVHIATADSTFTVQSTRKAFA